MTISIQPLHPTFAGEVSGVDCRRKLSADEVAAIEGGMDRFAVLVFREQPRIDSHLTRSSRLSLPDQQAMVRGHASV